MYLSIFRYFYDICKLCKKIFVNFTEYIDHLRSEHSEGAEETQVDCNICGKTVLLSLLDDHLKLYHSLGSLFRYLPIDYITRCTLPVPTY